MTIVRNLACLAIFTLAACGADSAPEPVEQIIVREPGEAPVTNAGLVPAGNSAGRQIAEGKAVFANCSACHTLNKGGANGAGPNLSGVAGRAAGTVEGFSYSDALKASGITWTVAELDSYIANPAAKVPGTTMVAGAIADPAKRRAVIAYIESATAN